MKYLLGALVLISILLFLLMRRPDGSAPPAEDPHVGQERPQPINSSTSPRNHPTAKQSPWSAGIPKTASETPAKIPSLEGIVTFKEDGRPVSGVTITAYRRSNRDPIDDATTSPEGKCAFYRLETGTYEIDVGPDKFFGVGNAVVIPGRATRCDIQVIARHIVRGVVKDEEGKPIRASVNARAQPPHVISAITNDRGEYEFGIYQPYQVFTVSAPFYHEERKWIEGNPERIDFILRKKKRREIEISGTVRDADNAPVSNARVRIAAESGEWLLGDVIGHGNTAWAVCTTNLRFGVF